MTDITLAEAAEQVRLAHERTKRAREAKQSADDASKRAYTELQEADEALGRAQTVLMMVACGGAHLL